MAQVPISAYRLSRDDKNILEKTESVHGLVSQTDAMRLCLRYFEATAPDPEEVKAIVKAYDTEKDNLVTHPILFKEPEPEVS